MKTLAEKYNDVCNEYVWQFCENYEFSYCEQDFDNVGVVWIGDFVFDLDTIRYCVDNDLKDEKELLEWYDYCSVVVDYPQIPKPNFRAWHMGCPRLDKEQIMEIRRLEQNVANSKQELEELIDNYADEKD